ncbi:uncharacterized protein LOC115095247 isoform X2 [Rhinatrema bivittatum]|uniref:uncharacterized protein LOC115095247 isoform X2 n=1 Tax=Rhinatrema bivittatum TaxID=194408 RepID=UPI00112E8BEF|nr:uncharacterized protein LOC115095247 isoform X2 [Rhinatrema bivittatum]
MMRIRVFPDVAKITQKMRRHFLLLRPRAIQISIQDLLCSIIALYDVSLPNIGMEDLRASICARGAKTIVLVQDEREVIEEYQKKISRIDENDYSTTHIKNVFVKQEEKEKIRMLSAVFSDSESSEDEEIETESERENKEQFNTAMKEFLAIVQERRQQRREMYATRAIFNLQTVGIESRILAALTFQRTVLKSKEIIIQLSLMSTRRRYRRCGVGKYMMKLLKDPSLVGLYDAIVTHADSGAVKFFKRCDFSDDILLNSKFREFEDDWTNTTTMSFFPPFNMGMGTLINIKDVELEIEFWKKKSLAAYQAQTVFMTRLAQETKDLRKQLISQKEKTINLAKELEKTKVEKFQLEKKVLQYQLEETQQLLRRESNSYSDDMEELQNEIKQEFIENLNDSLGMQASSIEVKELVQASIHTDVKISVDTHVSELTEPDLRTRLYYCGGLDQPERLKQILTSGFSIQDFHTGIYGKGLYFSSNASVACKFSPPHQLLVADVYLGSTETVLQKEINRIGPSEGFDSILIPGRLNENFSSEQSDLDQEFVIFSHLQVFPVCLLIYYIGEKDEIVRGENITNVI